MPLQRVGQQPDPRPQILDFTGSVQPQMAAGDLRPLLPGQAPQHRQARLPLQHRSKVAAQFRPALVEQDSPQAAVLPEALKPPDLRGQRQPRAAGAHHQQHRQLQGIRHLPDAGLIRAAHAVVQAHGPLAHRRPAAPAPLVKEILHGRPLREEQVQIMALHTQYGAVKHGIDIIRPAFEGAGVQPPAPQRRQKRAGDGGLSGGGCRGGHHQPDHGSSPAGAFAQMRKTGLAAVRR